MKHAKTSLFVISALVFGGAASCSTMLGFEDLVLDESGDGGVVDAADAPLEAATETGQPDADAGLPDADAGLPDADAAVDVVEDATGDATDADVAADVQDASEEEASCGDLLTDEKNCGECGHDCLGGECVDGDCQPFQLTTITDGSWGMAVNDSALCVAVQLNNEIHCRNKTTGSPLWIGDNFSILQPSWVALDETDVFWSNRVTNTGSIATCSLQNCTTPSKLIDPANRPNGVAVDGTSLYWAETTARTVKKANKDGTNVATLVPSTLNWSPFLITLHGGYVYFSERAGGRVARVPIGGGEAVILGTSAAPSKIAVTTDWVYWTDSNPGAVFRVPNAEPPDAGLTRETVALGQEVALGIAADEENVYWIASGEWLVAEGALRSCPIAGCPSGQPITLEDNLPYPIDVVMDDKALYYSIFGIDGAIDGAIRKLAKP